MVIQNLKSVIAKNQALANRDFLRNLLKEELQAYVLNFIYTSSAHRRLIFTGGTCLRKFYGLPRISEDLDFDIEGKDFDFGRFQEDINRYFREEVQYKDMGTKLKGRTVYLRFPLLKEIGFSGENDTNILFLRVDFSFSKSSNFQTEKLLFSSYDFSFLARTYGFSTLLTNKIAAFLTREYKKGAEQVESYKGRDVFDLVWLMGESKKTGLSVDMERLNDLMQPITKEELAERIMKKAGRIDGRELYRDLQGFFMDLNFVSDFCENFKDLLAANIKYL